MDPAPTVQLNNVEAVLSAAEREEEARILAQLSSAVAENAPRIWQVTVTPPLPACHIPG